MLTQFLSQFPLDLSQGFQVVPAHKLIAPTPQPAEGVDRAWSELQGIADYQAFVSPLPFQATQALIVTAIDAAILPAVRASLLRRYPSDYQIQSLAATGLNQTTLANASPAQAWYLPALSIEADLASPSTLEWIMARLAGPQGCPWDRKQTHASLREFLLEETHETLEALDAEDWPNLKEELGDLLLQIVFHAEFGRQAGRFDLDQVYAAINSKLIRRHPHIFGTTEVSDADEVLRNWDAIKATEHKEKGSQRESALDGIAKTLPPLATAQLMGKKAAKVGFDWPDISGVWEKVHEEIGELQAAASPEEQAAEFGDVLFALTNLARWLKIDSESALRGTIAKFRRRFVAVEQAAQAQGRQLSQLSLSEADTLWEAAKRTEKQ
ncbi:nucleoside triphosphate pyrophosphohydrolase [Herpetosiphon geysericola]|uniref:nucleoside triphosphate pyrophosphohydrolase n=1 Tax=Herpetosiphon geysericola TaxID=70996 RepID=UPI0006C8F4BD|nr:nucleoside triphosphate pyrophosphohydrolase [Herpetosiphon geysericola]